MLSLLLDQLVDCHGTPAGMGRQYGEAAREAIRTNAAIWQCDRAAGVDDAAVARIRRVLERHLPEVLAELEGVAAGSGVPVNGLLVMNSFGGPRSTGCTSMAVRSGSDGPLLGKNNDGDPDGRLFVVRRSVPDSGLPMVQVTYAGWVSGLDAMNGAGVANGHNSVGSVFDCAGDRVDIRLWAYRLMRHCQSSEAFVRGMAEVPLTGKGFNIVVTDACGDGAVLEAAVPLVSCRDRGGEFVYATNHYITAALAGADRRTPEKKAVSTYRYGYLHWQAQTRPPTSVSELQAVLCSHEPWAPCRHGGPHGSQTLWSMICRPRDRNVMVAGGHPCAGVYRTVAVD